MAENIVRKGEIACYNGLNEEFRIERTMKFYENVCRGLVKAL